MSATITLDKHTLLKHSTRVHHHHHQRPTAPIDHQHYEDHSPHILFPTTDPDDPTTTRIILHHDTNDDDGGGDDRVLVTYIQGPRQFSQLVVQDYRYVKHRANTKSTYWKCYQYDLGNCKARCVISLDTTVALRGRHTHRPEPNLISDQTVLFQETRRLVRHEKSGKGLVFRVGEGGGLVKDEEEEEDEDVVYVNYLE